MMARSVRSRLAVTRPAVTPSAIAANVALGVVALVFVIPLVWLVTSAVNRGAGLPLEFPTDPTLANFAKVLTWEMTFRPMLNGLILSGGSAVIVAVFATLAAYPLSRYKLRFGQPFLYGVLFGSCLPITAIMVPVYAMFVQVNLIDNRAGVILFMSATALPYAVWMTKNFMDAVPIELEEAAWTDGANSLQALLRIVGPLMVPGIVAIFVFNLIEAWGNFFIPFILLLDPKKFPIAVSLFNFFGHHGEVYYGQLAAFSIMYTVPVIVLYVMVQRVLQQAFRLQGAVKG